MGNALKNKQNKMKKPSEKQINAEIAKLEALKPKIPHFSIFGDNNYEKIDAQIEVLKEGLTEDEVYNRFEDTENPDQTADLVSNARDASLWLVGESEEGTPSKGWEDLAKSQSNKIKDYGENK
jgi:hypothetical protein